MKVKIEIKHYFTGKVLFEYESTNNTIKETLVRAVSERADLRGAYLRGAYLEGADLRGAKNIPQSYVNICSRDMLFVFEYLKGELPGLRKALVEGKIDGTQYEGDCACLIGTLGKLDGGLKNVCSMIPYYEMGLHNPGEQWFFQIKEGDTPETNEFSKHAVMLIDMVLGKQKKVVKKKVVKQKGK